MDERSKNSNLLLLVGTFSFAQHNNQWRGKLDLFLTHSLENNVHQTQYFCSLMCTMDVPKAIFNLAILLPKLVSEFKRRIELLPPSLPEGCFNQYWKPECFEALTRLTFFYFRPTRRLRGMSAGLICTPTRSTPRGAKSSWFEPPSWTVRTVTTDTWWKSSTEARPSNSLWRTANSTLPKSTVGTWPRVTCKFTSLFPINQFLLMRTCAPPNSTKQL